MKSNLLKDIIELESGSPQFRITELKTIDAPLYTYYSQVELEQDLAGFKAENTEKKQIRTKDDVRTLNNGDVVFSLISGKAAIVRKEHEGYLFTQNYIRLVLPKEIDSKYLVFLLNEDNSIKKQFQMSLQGSAVLKHTIKQIRDIYLPKMPELNKQKIIGNLYLKQLKLNKLKQRVSELETEILIEEMKGVV